MLNGGPPAPARPARPGAARRGLPETTAKALGRRGGAGAEIRFGGVFASAVATLHRFIAAAPHGPPGVTPRAVKMATTLRLKSSIGARAPAKVARKAVVVKADMSTAVAVSGSTAAMLAVGRVAFTALPQGAHHHHAVVRPLGCNTNLCTTAPCADTAPGKMPTTNRNDLPADPGRQRWRALVNICVFVVDQRVWMVCTQPLTMNDV
jgi:hypothetical protein